MILNSRQASSDLFRMENDPINICGITGDYPWTLDLTPRPDDAYANVPYNSAECAPQPPRMANPNNQVQIVTSVKEADAAKINLLTNPISSNIILELNGVMGSSISSIEMRDASNRIIYEAGNNELKNFDFTDNIVLSNSKISSAKSGIYTLRVYQDGICSIIKIVKL